MSEETGQPSKNNEDWLDFKAIKEQADVRKVLAHFGLLEYLEARGAELVGWCPFGEEHGKKDSFSINVEKKNFQCFACKARGSLLDFVGKFQNGHLREAAHTVLGIMGGSEEQANNEHKSGGRPYGKSPGGDKPASRPASPRATGPAGAALAGVSEAGAPARHRPRPDRDGDIPAVMSFSAASRLIIGKKINPETLLVINLSAVGMAWVKSNQE